MAKAREGTAIWERELKIIFCDLCLKEVDLGNRPTTHFNKEGWINLTNGFRERTGRDYSKYQLKNKWDQLKKDWKLWKELKRGATGLGWCAIRNTIDASEEWWREKLEVIPNAKKFRFSGIDPELEEKLDRMFTGVVAMGLHARTTTMDGPTIQEDSPLEPSQGSSDDFPVELGNDTPTTIPTPSFANPSSNKRKRGKDDFVKQGLATLIDSYSSLASAKTSKLSTPMIEAVKILQSIPEIRSDKRLLMQASIILENPAKRDAFMGFDPELRLDYIMFQLTGDL